MEQRSTVARKRLTSNSTTYTSVRPTVFNVAGSSLVTRKDAPYTPLDWTPDKRDIKTAPESTTTPTPVLEPRQAALPGYASLCTGDTNRLSSACTCLIGETAETPVRRALEIPGGKPPVLILILLDRRRLSLGPSLVLLSPWACATIAV